jgi:hypothetical protein
MQKINMMTLGFLHILYCQKNKSAPNTDNKGKLFVTVFAFAPAPRTNS